MEHWLLALLAQRINSACLKRDVAAKSTMNWDSLRTELDWRISWGIGYCPERIWESKSTDLT